MKKGYWKGFVTGLLLTGLVLGLALSAGAAGRTIAVEDGASITLNGVSYIPRDDKGGAMEYFSYNGATYVPLRAFAKAVGIETSYNANTKTEALATPDGYLPVGYITAGRAKELALSHAGVKAADAVFYQVKISWNETLPIYEVGFYSGDFDYFYSINAQTGAVISWDRRQADGGTPSDYITAGRAKELALSHAGVKAADATFFRARLDWNDGQPEYEVGFYTSTTEYNYSINAKTGAVLDWDSERLENGSQGGGQSDYITAERAKELALADAGMKAADATFVKVKFDWDDGRAEYEIKFYGGAAEYEYEIDAKTGAILNREIDRDDGWDDGDWEDYYEWCGRHGNGCRHDWGDWDD